MRFCKHKTNGSFGENKLLPDVRQKTYKPLTKRNIKK